ncbi:MAG TPA: hypothetical protein VKZ60_07475 [Chloroflexota bacterium]|nr:hypothetical protein [Chloroflexota bacterium]
MARSPASASARPAPQRAGGSPTPPFLWAAIAAAALPGFALGAVLFGHRGGLWWAAAAQAHGHAQLFGWAGLLVIGVLLHFLPRLRGAPLRAPRATPWILGLYGGGLALRVVAQPLAPLLPALGPLLPLSAGLELAGALLASAVLLSMVRAGAPLAQRPGFVQLVPWLIVGLPGFLLGLGANLLAMGAAATAPLALAPAPWGPAAVLLGLYGFLVPIAVAMSARTLPLYLRVRPPTTRGLNVVLAVLVAGLLLRLAAAGAAPGLAALGQLALAAALVGACWQLDVPLTRTRAAILAEARRRAAAYGQAPRPLTESERGYLPAELLVRSAYGWLLVAALLLGLGSLAELVGLPAPPADAERHAVGAGYITLLILGVGVYLLPGFQGRRLASLRLVWATLWLGNLGALLRVVSVLVSWALAAPSLGWLTELAGVGGLVDLVAVLLFAGNLWRTWR